MKVTHFFSIIFLTTLILSCNKDAKDEVALDVVNDTQAVREDSWRTKLVRELQSAPDDVARTAILEKNGTRLTTQLVSFLRSERYNCPIDTIMYRYGGGKAIDVASGDGNKYSGEFKSQPYAVIQGGACFGDQLYVFIRCFNGTFSINSKNSTSIGGGSQVFTIEKGKGINYYADYRTTIWIAENFELPLYKGSGWKSENIISPEEALQLESQLADVQVTVRVHPGDRFDLRNMTLNGKQ
jgi:hypothetical protein